MRNVILKNAGANLFRLVISGMVALVLPPILIRNMSASAYGTWMLLLQLLSYVTFLEFGMQVALSRFVAHAEEIHRTDQRDGIVSTAFAILGVAALFGLCLFVVLAWRLPHIFPAMPTDLQNGGRTALLLMGATYAISLPFSTIQAVFIGKQRNEIPVAIAIITKLTMTALVLYAVVLHFGMAGMGLGVGISNALMVSASFYAWRTWAPDLKIRRQLVSKYYGRQIIHYCLGLAVWQLSLFLISGVDLVILGKIDYPAIPYYATAVTLTSVVTLAQTAICSALLPASAVLGAREDSQRLGALLISSTRYGTLILLFISVLLILGSSTILQVWMGKEFAIRSTLIMQILIAANVVRLLALPYAMLVLGVGLQGHVILSPIAEGLTNLAASIVGAYLWGAIGVALGTLIGAFVGVTVHFVYHMPRLEAIAIDRLSLAKEGWGRPLVCVFPFLVLVLFHFVSTTVSLAMLIFLSSIAAVGACYLLWTVGLRNSERQQLERLFSI